jgi:hypothetical protein
MWLPAGAKNAMVEGVSCMAMLGRFFRYAPFDCLLMPAFYQNTMLLVACTTKRTAHAVNPAASTINGAEAPPTSDPFKPAVLTVCALSSAHAMHLLQWVSIRALADCLPNPAMLRVTTTHLLREIA